MDLVDYLEKLSYRPIKVAGNDYWYLSPLREEKTASFKVNRKKNVWYDHGSGNGGTFIDFAKLYHQCSIKELLDKFSQAAMPTLSFHPHPAGEKKETINKPGLIETISSGEIKSYQLKQFLEQRKIPLEVAGKYCSEVAFKLYQKVHTALGFKNDLGGYELRNQYFKGSSSPKRPTTIEQSSNEFIVFEGFFNFLSYQTIRFQDKILLKDLPKVQADFLVLNSLSFFEKSRNQMEKYQTVHLFLDRDKTGIKCTEKALQWSAKYIDQSRYYDGFKDLNEYLIKSTGHELKQSHRKGMNL
ncbi:MAG: toprim domain-containing protein [Chitinophagaceae bacterium]